MTTTSPPDFLSVREAAAVLRIGKTCAYEFAQQFVHTSGGSGSGSVGSCVFLAPRWRRCSAVRSPGQSSNKR